MAIFGSGLKDKVLQFFLDYSYHAFYVKEISDRLGVDLGNLSRLLRTLEKSGILIARRQGKYLTYKLNSDHILFDRVAQKSPISVPLNLRTLIHGEAIASRAFEIITSSWGAQRFANFCNAVISEMFSTQALRSEFIQLTERINVRDSGIDAQCDVLWSKDAESYLRTGRNAFQFKLRDTASNRAKTIAVLKRDLKEEAQAIKNISSYILFINIDLTAAEKTTLIKAIADGLSGKAANIVICAAAELAALCNQFPRIRSSYFVPADFSNWHEAYKRERENAFWPWVDFIGNQEEIKQVQQRIADAAVKVIYLTGPQGIGKSRIVLEATAPFRDQVVFVRDRNKFSSKDMTLLDSNSETIIVVDDPELDEIEEAVKEVCGRSKMKLIVMVPTSADSTRPGFGLDPRSIAFPVRLFSNEDADKLIRQINKSISYDLLSWIKYHASGNPGILLMAAMASDSLRDKPESFIDALGAYYERRIGRALGADALNTLRLVSISTFVGISEGYKNEIEIILKIFGEGLTLNRLAGELDRLKKAGLVNRTGSFVEVVIPLLATYFAQQLIRGREQEVTQLFVELSGSARIRFMKRLARLSPQTISGFRNEIFSADGLFSDIGSIRSHSSILRVMSGAVPERVVEVLKAKIEPLSLEQRKNIEGDFRSDLRWSLEQLIMRQATSLKALELMGLLAEVENETWANNATGVFKEAFFPIHPQIPLRLDDRFGLLKKFVDSNSSAERRLWR